MNHNHNLLMLKTTPQPPQTLCPPCENGSPEETSNHPSSPETESQLASQLRLMAGQSKEWTSAAGGSTPDLVANWSAPQYLVELRDALASLSESPDRIKLLRQAINDAVALQKGGFWTPHLEINRERVQLNRERLTLDQEKHRHTVALSQPPARKHRDYTQPLTDAERQAILDKADEIFGLK